MPSWHLIFSARIPAIDKGCLIHNIHVLLICSINMAIWFSAWCLSHIHPSQLYEISLGASSKGWRITHVSMQQWNAWWFRFFVKPIVSGSTWIHLHCRIYIYQPVLNAPGCNLLYSVRTTSALSSNFACSSFNFLRCRRRHVSSLCQCWPWVIHGHAIYHPFHGATYLVGGFNPSEKYESQLGLLFPIYYIYGKIKNVPNHQPVMCKSTIKPRFLGGV